MDGRKDGEDGRKDRNNGKDGRMERTEGWEEKDKRTKKRRTTHQRWPIFCQTCYPMKCPISLEWVHTTGKKKNDGCK
jgi:hypothetical protein